MRNMRVPVVTLLLLSVACAVWASTDVCDTTTADVKAATRTLNMWRAACEDHNWKGSTCYNYWAQLNEVMTLDNNLQTCLAGIFKQHQEYMLGSADKQGAFAADYGTTKQLEHWTTDTAQGTVAAEGLTNRNHITNTATNSISDMSAEVRAQAGTTRDTVTTKQSELRDYETLTHNQIRALESSNTAQILLTKIAQEKLTRDNVDAQHSRTVSEITSVESIEETSTRATTASEFNDTRTLEHAEQVTLRTLVSREHATTNTLDISEESNTRANAATQESNTRTFVATANADTNGVLASETAGEKAETNTDAQATQSQAQFEAETTRAFTADQSAQTRAMFSTLQVALQAMYTAEGGVLSGMWGDLIRILVHYDLQGPRCVKFGETHTFSTLSSAGFGRLEQLRSETNQTMVVNENYYGSTKVGRARAYWNSAETYLAAGNYRVAADQYRIAYQEAVVARS